MKEKSRRKQGTLKNYLTWESRLLRASEHCKHIAEAQCQVPDVEAKKAEKDRKKARVSTTPYHKDDSFDTAKDEIMRMARSQFDPLAVEAFLAEETVLREMVLNKCYIRFSL